MTEEEKSKIPLHKSRLDLPDKEALEKVRKEKRKGLVQDMAVVFDSPEGRRVLTYMMDLCGFKKGKIGGNPQLGMNILEGTLYNCAREAVFLEMSEFIPVNILRKAEYGVAKDLEL